jgi:preprotein translocase subunit SecG
MNFLKTKLFNIISVAMAQSNSNEPIFKSYKDIISFLEGITNIFASIFWIFAVFFGIYSAYLFVFEGASEEKVTKAKKMLFYTVIAIAVGLMAYGLPALVKSILQIRS